MAEITVSWKAAWWGFDQAIKVGLKEDFWIFNNGTSFKFYTGIAEGETETNYEIINGEIISIQHKNLGDIKEIDTNDLVYKITLDSGQYFLVDAEERVGEIETSPYMANFDDDNYLFEVKIRTKPV